MKPPSFRKFYISIFVYLVLVLAASFVLVFCFDFTKAQHHTIDIILFGISIIFAFFWFRAWKRFIKKLSDQHPQNPE